MTPPITFPFDLQPFYRYNALGNATRNFRVVRLQPLDNDGIIRGTLEELDISSPEPYIAISYEWGPPQPKRTINIDGIDFVIRRNIHECLKLYAAGLLEDRLLFTDAICIDHGNNVERSQQVKVMGKIYEFATEVFVWLGLESTQLRPIFEFATAYTGREPTLYELWHRVREDPRDISFWQNAPKLLCNAQESTHYQATEAVKRLTESSLRVDPSQCLTSELPFGNELCLMPGLGTAWRDRSEADYLCLRCLVQTTFNTLSYWTRVWIVQEIVLGQYVTVHCGGVSVKWSSLAQATETLYPPGDSLTQMQSFQILSGFTGIRDLKAQRSVLNDKAIMSIMHQRECSDHRDRVYGSLGLLQYGERIVVDYTHTRMQVFIMSLHFMIDLETETPQLQAPYHFQVFEPFVKALRLDFPLDIDDFRAQMVTMGFNDRVVEFQLSYAEWNQIEEQTFDETSGDIKRIYTSSSYSGMRSCLTPYAVTRNDLVHYTSCYDEYERSLVLILRSDPFHTNEFNLIGWAVEEDDLRHPAPRINGRIAISPSPGNEKICDILRGCSLVFRDTDLPCLSMQISISQVIEIFSMLGPTQILGRNAQTYEHLMS